MIVYEKMFYFVPAGFQIFQKQQFLFFVTDFSVSVFQLPGPRDLVVNYVFQRIRVMLDAIREMIEETLESMQSAKRDGPTEPGEKPSFPDQDQINRTPLNCSPI